jgi:hypothetical protein
MKINLHTIKIADVVDGYVDSDEKGVSGYGGKLNIRPAYQREFIYGEKERGAVIDTIFAGFPLNVMYWVKNSDGTFEVLDGQQRTISFCSYHAGEFMHVVDDSLRGWANLTESQKARFLNYELQVYICEGTPEEILKWFRIINIAGMKLTDQELRNAAYYGPWLSDAKRKFSKSSCVAAKLGGDYVSGNPIRQELLETALEWIANYNELKGGIDKDPIAEYMAIHQNDSNCDELWVYFQDVIHWIRKVFPNYRKQMKGLPWGILYNEHHNQVFSPTDLEQEIVRMLKDSDVQKKQGIWPYLLTGDERFLSIRAFDDNTKVTIYERQGHHCANPDCFHGPDKVWELDEMEADHIVPWSKGGHTVIDNCQLLCRDCNRKKSAK